MGELLLGRFWASLNLFFMVENYRVNSAKREPRVAIVHDWLPLYAGAERVLEQIIALFPQADLFSLIDLIKPEDRAFLGHKPVCTSFLQRWKWVRTRYRSFLPLMPSAIEQFDLSAYDLILSSSYAVAKGVLTGPDQLHICYCHSPMRYAWDLQFQYLKTARLTHGPASWLARAVLHYMRNWDAMSERRVDHFIANSQFIRGRIRKVYGRKAAVIHPPVEIEKFPLCLEKEGYYLTVSRLVPYKAVGVIVEAFAQMPHLELRVVGDGPEFSRISASATRNVTMLGYRDDAEVRRLMQRAKAFVFAGEEDFGIVPVEAQACGTPVIAYGRGGVLETVVDGETGLFFPEQTAESLCEAVARLEDGEICFDPRRIRRHAEQFSAARFRVEFSEMVQALRQAFTHRNGREEALPSNRLLSKLPRPPRQNLSGRGGRTPR